MNPNVPPPFVCLMYHNVTPGAGAFADFSPSVTSYFVDAETFAAHLAELRSAAARLMRLGDLEAYYGTPQPPPALRGQFPVLLTFDDGWAGSVDVAGPVLEEAGGLAGQSADAGGPKSLVFVTTDFIGRPHFLGRGDLARLPALFRVGSHARSHRMLSRLDEREIRGELQDSKNLLEDATGYAVETVSIPGGAVDARVRRIAGEVGYRYLFTSEVHANRRGGDALGIGRVAVKRTTTRGDIARYARGRFGREQLRRWVLRAPKRMIGLARYERLRRRLLGETESQQVTPEP